MNSRELPFPVSRRVSTEPLRRRFFPRASTVVVSLASSLCLFGPAQGHAAAVEFEDILTSGAIRAHDRFGSELAVWEDIAVVGVPLKDSLDGDDTGVVEIWVHDADGWHFDAEINPPPGAGDRFGEAVAIDNGVVVVGAPRVDWGGGRDMGLVFVYQQGLGGAWLLQQTLEHPDPSRDGLFLDGDLFGQAVAVSGNTIAVWAERTNVDGRGGLFDDSGSVEVFDRDVLGWSHTATLVHPEGRIGAMEIDGDVIVARGNLDSGFELPETTKVFERVEGSWLVTGTLPPAIDVGVSGAAVMVVPAWSLPNAARPVIYEPTDTGWGEVAALSGITPVIFTNTVAMSGNRILWTNGLEALVFRNDGAGWLAEGIVSIPDERPEGDLDVPALYGSKVLLGDPGSDGSGMGTENGGEVYAYRIVPDEEVDTDGDGILDVDEIELGTDPFDTDSDDDGLDDGDEVTRGTDPLDGDSDDDGLGDGEEVTRGTDPLDTDSDDDGLGDGEEVTRGTDPLDGDSDDDGLSDGDEVTRGTDPLDADSDDDGLSDGEEVTRGTDPLDADSDDDGLSDGDEVTRGTDPLDTDSDDDGLGDGEEVTRGTDPLDGDSDDDGLSDGDEVTRGTDPLDGDSDDDGLSDGDEVTRGTDPLDADSDDDGLSDGDEVTRGTDPLDADSDDDGLGDGDEVEYGTDPTDPDTDGDGLPDGSDVEFIQGQVAALALSAFSAPGHPTAIHSRLDVVEGLLLEGNVAAAIQELENLLRRLNGCGAGADRDDWVIDCTSQVQIRSLIQLLIDNLAMS
jgi:hypothetical protein